MDLKGSTVFVTGAAKRIGKAIALAFAERGARLVVHYHTSEQEAGEVCDQICALGAPEPLLICADLSDPAEIDLLFERNPEIGDISVLINSASIFYKTPIKEATPRNWSDFMSTNVMGPFYLARTIGLRLKEQKRDGLIVNLTDRSAKRPYADYAPYCASKAALENVTRSLAEELAPTVRVNSVAPGAILFPENYGQAEKDAILKAVPLGRAGKPEDIAAACLFLAESDYVNGTTITVDGGRSLFG